MEAEKPPKAPRRTSLRLTSPLPLDPLEDVHQEKLFVRVAFWENQYPALGWLFHVPNGGHRAKATAAALKRQGVKPGVLDLCLPVSREMERTDPHDIATYPGLWLEMKRERNGEVSEDQEKWLKHFESEGYRSIVCWGVEAAWEEICWYVGIPIEKQITEVRESKRGYLERKTKKITKG
jgi:hypothetical protein